MNLLENIRLALEGLRANKMRALLTMLGIIIGIGSVIGIVSIGGAMTNTLTNEVTQLGLNKIAVQVYPRDTSGAWYYTEDDVFTDEIIEEYQRRYSDEVEAVGYSYMLGDATTTVRRVETKASVNGVVPGFEKSYPSSVNITHGRFINESDVNSAKYVAVVAESFAETAFPGVENPVGQEVKLDIQNIGRETFTVIGVYEEQQNGVFVSTTGPTSEFYIPITTAYNIEDYHPAGTQYFYVAATQGIDYTAFAEETAEFFDNYYFNRNDRMHCYTESLESTASMLSDMLGTVSMAIAVIAAISLLVGGIGVMNIMLVSVTERTREIGIRKALGAPDSAIRVQFIVESMIICAIGGILGILLGAGIGSLAGMLLGSPAAPSLSAIVVAVGFSMLIGVFFGFYPANKAAKLDPIESLRYE